VIPIQPVFFPPARRCPLRGQLQLQQLPSWKIRDVAKFRQGHVFGGHPENRHRIDSLLD